MDKDAEQSALAFLFVVFFYRAPAGIQNVVPRLRIDLTWNELSLAILSGLVRTFYNIGFILVLTFGPTWLIAQGHSAQSASATMSVVSWVIIPAVPLGAWFAERLSRPLLTMMVSFLLAVLAVGALPIVGTSLVLLTIIGLIFGPPGGLIMALPGQAAAQQRRACRYRAMAFTWHTYRRIRSKSSSNILRIG